MSTSHRPLQGRSTTDPSLVPSGFLNDRFILQYISYPQPMYSFVPRSRLLAVTLEGDRVLDLCHGFESKKGIANSSNRVGHTLFWAGTRGTHHKAGLMLSEAVSGLSDLFYFWPSLHQNPPYVIYAALGKSWFD